MNSTTTSAPDRLTPHSPPPGDSAPHTEVFHHYQVLRREDGSLWELGRGAMGVTYKAFDVNLRSPVALKVVSPHALADETVRGRFVREARAAARLRHRNVASVYHLGQDGRSFFYAMEFVDGETLETRVRRDGPLPATLAIRLTLQVARALGAAHREGLVHRDIKPANLMIVPDEDEDSGLLVKVIDFGLARSAIDSARPVGADSSTGSLSALTHAGFVGTPLFASPEQLEEHEVDIRSDIYSLGVTLWYVLTGSPPFTGSLASIISQHLTREPPWENLDTLGEPNVVGALRGLLSMLLAKDRNLRPADPAALRRELEETLRELPPDDGDATVSDLSSWRSGPLAAPAHPLPSTEAPLASRYEIVQPVGEGSAGRVFLARDLAPGQDGQLVALKMLHADLLVSPEDEATLADLVQRARAATHPNLLEILSLERDGGRHFVIQEWVHGFNLIALLRSRGALGAVEIYPLLDAAAAAFDAARAGGMPARRLELGLHQVMLHFPDASPTTAEPPPVPAGPLTDWPGFQVKIDPLGIGREVTGGDPLLTWTGDQTLVPVSSAPPIPPHLLTHDTRSGLVGENTTAGEADEQDLAAGLRALAGLIYSLLGGSAAAMVDAGPMARYVNLPALSERANAALRRAFLPGADGAAGFRNAREFAESLRGNRPATVMPEPLSGLPVAPSAPLVPEPLPTTPVEEEPPPPPESTRSRPTRRVPPELMTSREETLEVSPVAPAAAAYATSTFPLDGTHVEAGSTTANTSIAHLLDDSPSSSPGRFPVLATLMALALLGILLAAVGGVFDGRFHLADRGGSKDSAPAVESPTARPVVVPPRKASPTPAASRPLVASSTPAVKPTATPSPLARPTPPPPRVEENASTPPALIPAPRTPELTPTARRETEPAVKPVTPPVVAPAAPVHSPTPGPPVHRVRVNLFSEPSGAELTLDEQSLGVAPQTITLPPGEYTVRARYGDWPEASRAVRVPAEGVESVDARIKLTPRAPGHAPSLHGPEGLTPAPPPGSEETGAGNRHGASPRAPSDSNTSSPESQALPAIAVPEATPEGGF